MTEPESKASFRSGRRGQPEPPPEVVALAERRAAARAGRDFAEADRLRGEVEAAGWRVIDHGTAFELKPAHPADVDVGGEIRYGRSDSLPSRFDEPDAAPATIVVVAREDPDGAARAVRSVLAHEPSDTEVVLVADGLPDAALRATNAGGLESAGGNRFRLLRTSQALGQGAAWNIGLRQAGGGLVAILDASIELLGPVTPILAAALEDPRVAVVGPWGLASADLRRFEEVEGGDAAAIEAYLIAFRRADAAARGPIDEGFRFYRNLDIGWSLVLRDEADGPPRRALVTPGLPIARHEHRAWLQTPTAERDRLSKRNFYRVLDRFGGRSDLAVPAG